MARAALEMKAMTKMRSLKVRSRYDRTPPKDVSMAATTAMATYRDSSWGTDGRRSSASTAPIRSPTKAAMSAVRRLGVVDGDAPGVSRHRRRLAVADGE